MNLPIDQLMERVFPQLKDSAIAETFTARMSFSGGINQSWIIDLKNVPIEPFQISGVAS